MLLQPVWREASTEHGSVPAQINPINPPEDTSVSFHKSLSVAPMGRILELSNKQASAVNRNVPNLHHKQCCSTLSLLECT